MTIELKVYAEDVADLKHQLSELLGGAAPLEPSAPASEKSSPTSRASKPSKTSTSGEIEKPSDGKAESEPTVEPKAETPPADDTGKAEPSVDYDAVKTATLALVKAKGRDAAVKVLTAHGAAGGATELKPEQYADYLAAVQEAMA